MNLMEELRKTYSQPTVYVPDEALILMAKIIERESVGFTSGQVDPCATKAAQAAVEGLALTLEEAFDEAAEDQRYRDAQQPRGAWFLNHLITT